MHAHPARAVAGSDCQVFRAMEPGRRIEQKEQIDDIGQRTLPLDIPTDFTGAAQLARAAGQPEKSDSSSPAAMISRVSNSPETALAWSNVSAKVRLAMALRRSSAVK